MFYIYVTEPYISTKYKMVAAMKFFKNAVNYLRSMCQNQRSLQAGLLLVIIAGLSFLFYISPSTDYIQTSKLYSESVSFESDSATGGIGGGNIKGNCIYGKRALPIYSVEYTNGGSSGNSKYISLSFDAAWGDEDTLQILDILDKYNIKVTFFMTGGWVSAYPDMVKEIYSRGHDLGNHSENHKEMSKLSVPEQKEEIQKVTDKVKELTGCEMFLFRPPYGDYNSTLITTAYSLNYYPIQWSVDSLDWKDYGTENIINTVTRNKDLGNGAIILMHNGAKFTAKALESVITNLINQGYTFIPISELIIKQDFHMDGTGRQIAD